MARVTFGGPIKAGTIKYNTYENLGSVLLTQTIALTETGATYSTTVTGNPQNLFLPFDNSQAVGLGSQIVSIWVDVLAVFGTGTYLSIGNGSSAALYAGGSTGACALTATGRITPTYSPAQLLALSNGTTNDITSGTAGGSALSQLVFTVTDTSAVTTGSCFITIQYTMPNSGATVYTQ